jgi:multicomponent Na+:H+ antiporter subunit B
MKRLPIITLILISLLCALFIYIAEDIPVLGDPNSPPIKFVRLFSIDADALEDHLNRGVIPSNLMDKLEGRRFPRPSRVEKVIGMEGEWNGFISKEEMHYSEEEKYYWVKKEGDKLSVYRYAFVVRWIEKGQQETGTPNMVTHGLADYRGYDTLGETVVIFTAGVSVILLLRRRGKL